MTGGKIEEIFEQARRSDERAKAEKSRFRADAQAGAAAAACAAGTVSIEFSHEQLALDFAARYAGDLLFVSKFNRWRRWSGLVWAEDSTLTAYDSARTVCRVTALSAPRKIQQGLASAPTVNAVVTLARTDPRIVRAHDIFDRDPWLLNTPGGVVDLRTGKLRENRRDDLITKITAVAPSESADCPLWRAFLERIMRRDDPRDTEKLISYLRRLAGYCLTGITTESLIAFAHGDGSNGKTTYVEAIAGVMGAGYARAVPAETFLASKSDRHPTEIANLMGARLVTASEIGPGRSWNESRLKELTGGDRCSGRFMRGDFFEFTPVLKLIIYANEKPKLRRVNEAMRRRLHLIPFTIKIPIEERDKDLKLKLQAEWPAILRWAIEGCLEWQRDGLNPPPEVCAATEQYFEENDVVGRWREECTEDAPVFTSSKDLYASFKPWCEAESEFVIPQKSLGEALEAAGYKPYRSGQRGFIGLRIK